jgi:hypothetical protein
MIFLFRAKIFAHATFKFAIKNFLDEWKLLKAPKKIVSSSNHAIQIHKKRIHGQFLERVLRRAIFDRIFRHIVGSVLELVFPPTHPTPLRNRDQSRLARKWSMVNIDIAAHAIYRRFLGYCNGRSKSLYDIP